MSAAMTAPPSYSGTPTGRRSSTADKVFLTFVCLLLIRGLFSGWDLSDSFGLPKILKWAIELLIYFIPGLIALWRLRGRHVVTGVFITLAYLVISFFFGVTSIDSNFGLEKSLTLTIINAVQLVSIVTMASAVFTGAIVLPDKLIDRLAQFGLAYIFVCIGIGAYMAYGLLQGGEVTIVGKRFFFINPVSMRMSATFSEPSYFGFYVGFCALLYRSRFKTGFSIFVLLAAAAMLYFAIGAKFAIIAFPLAIIFGLMERQLAPNTVRTVFYGTFIAIILATNIGFDRFIYHNLVTEIDAENQQTFVTRFAYLFTSMHHLLLHPIGSGFGGWMFTLPADMQDTIDITRGLDNGELIENVATGVDFAPKDTTSLVLLLGGWLGLIALVEGFMLLFRLCRRTHVAGSMMAFFLLLSVAVYINAGAVPMFLPLLLLLIADLRSSRHTKAFGAQPHTA